MNRHQRRKDRVIEAKMMPLTDIKGARCAWADCTESFSGDMPRGWSWLLSYWSPRPPLNLDDIQEWHRDCCLCPLHAPELDGQLKDLGRVLLGPAAGTA